MMATATESASIMAHIAVAASIEFDIRVTVGSVEALAVLDSWTVGRSSTTGSMQVRVAREPIGSFEN